MFAGRRRRMKLPPRTGDAPPGWLQQPYIRYQLLRARPADYMLALSVARGSLPVVGKHLKPLGSVTAIGVWARHASDLSATTWGFALLSVRRRESCQHAGGFRRGARGITADDLAVE